MAGDMMLLMRGLAKLSQAVVETQSSTLRAGQLKKDQFVWHHHAIVLFFFNVQKIKQRFFARNGKAFEINC